MNKKMSGFIDPYSLGLVISLVGVLLVQITNEEYKPSTQVTQSVEDVDWDHETQIEHSLNPNEAGREYDI